MGSYTFNKCQELATVSIPSSLGTAKKLTLYNLRDEHFNNDNNYNGSSSSFGFTFWECTKLTNVTLNDGIRRLAPNMFYGCTGIKTINLPSSILRLNSALSYCSGLTALKLPDGLTQTGSFVGCSGLKSLVIPNGVTSLPDGREVSWGADYQDGCFTGCTSLTSVTLPNQLNKIPTRCFMNCTALASITIPNTVTDINGYAFMDVFSPL